jgi:hypothetical protein
MMTSDAVGFIESGDSPAKFQSIAGPWAHFRWSFRIYIMLSGLLVASDIHAYLFIDAAFNSSTTINWAMADFVDLHQTFTAIGLLIALISCMIAYGRFYTRALATTKRIDPELEHLNVHGVWLWYAVPFAAFIMPFRRVRQVWEVVHRRAGMDSNLPASFALWWTAWLGGNFLATLETKLPGAAWSFQIAETNYEQYLLVLVLNAVGSGISIISALGIFSITRKIAMLLSEPVATEPEKD